MLQNTYISSTAQISSTAIAALSGWTRLSTKDFATNTLTFTGLSGANAIYALVVDGASGAAAAIRMYVNGDTTAAHYDAEMVQTVGTGIYAQHYDDAAALVIENDCGGIVMLHRSNTGYVYWSGETAYNASSRTAHICGMKTDATIAEITSITVTAGAITGRATLFKVGEFA